MIQEKKDFLLKDICSRLPYGVKVGTTDIDGSLENVWEVLWYNVFTEDIKLINCTEIDADKIVDISEVKPYLFPLSSMTEEQKEEYYGTFSLSGDISGSVDFYNKHHLDWRGLIPKGLANDATGKNIY